MERKGILRDEKLDEKFLESVLSNKYLTHLK
jgi:hypothetical protein